MTTARRLKNSFRSPGKIITLFSLLFTLGAAAQETSEIGKVNGEAYTITADTVVLQKALNKTLGDGTKITHTWIISSGSFHYLVGKGIKGNYSKLIAVQLEYKIGGRTFHARSGMPHVTCASASCNDCGPFIERGKIIGCRCSEQGTVSNECDFGTRTESDFFRNLKHFSSLKK